MRAEAHKNSSPLRRLHCEKCGREFDCGLGGECWCAAEPYRLPMPEGGDCLCPECLRMAARAQQAG